MKKMMKMKHSCVVLASLVLTARNSLSLFTDATHQTTTGTTTSYQLTYDSFISSKKKKSYYENSNDVSNAAENATKIISSFILRSTSSISRSKSTKVKLNDVHCFPIKLYQSYLQTSKNNDIDDSSDDDDTANEAEVVGTKCFIDQKYSDCSLEVTTSIYTADNSCLSQDSPLAFSLDAAIRSSSSRCANKVPRNTLVQLLDIIEKDVIATNGEYSNEHVNDLNIAWNIFDRSTPAVNNEEKEGEGEGEGEEDTQSALASIEKRMLNNPDITSKKQIIATYTKSKAEEEEEEDTSSTKPTTQEPKNEVWEYKHLWTINKSPHHDFFIDSYLRATTTDIGQAHAEAFIHPAMVSHALPQRIAVISDMPVVYVKEILKYESVKEIAIIGAEESNINIVTSFLPQINNCSLIQDVSDECMKDSKVEIVKDDLSTWLDGMVHKCKGIDFHTYCDYDSESDEYSLCAPEPLYDVIFVDIASSGNVKEWLSQEVYAKYFQIITFDSIIVFNIGSPPTSEGTQHDVEPLQQLLRIHDEAMIQIEDSMDTMGVMMVYDEPAAEPLNSAFIINIQYHSEAYHRFVRETPIAYDLDLMNRLHPQPLPPTKFYDGATHLRYLRPNRSWENWYCDSFRKESVECTLLQKNWYDRTRHRYKTVVLPNPIKGRSLYAAEDIPKGAFINSGDTEMHLHMNSLQWEALNVFIKNFPEAKLYKELRNFFVTYGFQNEPIGLSGWSVSIASNNTFTNHGCTEEARNVQAYPFSNDPVLKESAERTRFSIFMSRRPQLLMATGTLRDIKEGEEIAMDYLAFRTFPERKFVEFLDGICNTGVGLVEASDGSGLGSCIDDKSCF